MGYVPKTGVIRFGRKFQLPDFSVGLGLFGPLPSGERRRLLPRIGEGRTPSAMFGMVMYVDGTLVLPPRKSSAAGTKAGETAHGGARPSLRNTLQKWLNLYAKNSQLQMGLRAIVPHANVHGQNPQSRNEWLRAAGAALGNKLGFVQNFRGAQGDDGADQVLPVVMEIRAIHRLLAVLAQDIAEMGALPQTVHLHVAGLDWVGDLWQQICALPDDAVETFVTDWLTPSIA